MTGKRLEGIDGVLGNLLSAPSRETGRFRNVAHHDDRPQEPTFTSRIAKHGKPQGARLGRPLGKTGDVRSAKEKATLHISSSLLAEYRDRSWEARCSLSGLIERAMIEYRQRLRSFVFPLANTDYRKLET